ncbi:MAG: hypothetical protein AAF903_10385 [Pseudomonadota bacterium]
MGNIYVRAAWECTPKTLQNLLHIPARDADRYVAQLLAEGAIKGHPMVQQSVSQLTQSDRGSVLDRLKKRFEMKREQGQSQALQTDDPVRSETTLESDAIEAKVDMDEDSTDSASSEETLPVEPDKKYVVEQSPVSDSGDQATHANPPK